jgi:hypothetical protein
MPEYRYPGVYVEEIDVGGRSIPGVSTSTAGLAFEPIASDVRRAMREHAPEWTNEDDSDPGVTLLQIFAFLSENLLYRANQIPERGRTAAARAAAALALLADRGERPCEGLQRPSYFVGRLLDADALTTEQNYHREKLRRHNRALLGSGVVSGLDVRVEAAPDATGERVVVEPGYAIDPNGEEIPVPCSVALTPPAQGEIAFVTLRFWERPCSPVSVVADEKVAPAMIEEACVIGITDAPPPPPAIPIARLLRVGDRWRVDPGFAAPHARGGGAG